MAHNDTPIASWTDSRTFTPSARKLRAIQKATASNQSDEGVVGNNRINTSRAVDWGGLVGGNGPTRPPQAVLPPVLSAPMFQAASAPDTSGPGELFQPQGQIPHTDILDRAPEGEGSRFQFHGSGGTAASPYSPLHDLPPEML